MLNHWLFPFESMSSRTPFHGGRYAFSRLLGGWIEEDSVIVNRQMCDVPVVAWEIQPLKHGGSFRRSL